MWVRPALATQSCSDCGNPCGTKSRAGVASRAHPRLSDKGPAIVARPRPLRGVARLSPSVPEPMRRETFEHAIRWTLPNLVGLSAALGLLLSARRVGAEEALRLRLVDRVTPPGELMDQVRAYASELAEAVSPRSMRVMKRQLWKPASRAWR